MAEINYGDIRMGDKLGEGASGQVFKGDWDGKEVAVKVFKGEITSDGLPECEMDAMVAAGGAHPNLPKVLSPSQTQEASPKSQKTSTTKKPIPTPCLY